jgi:hypothetical protein
MDLHYALGVLRYHIHFDIRVPATARSGMTRAVVLFNLSQFGSGSRAAGAGFSIMYYYYTI